MAFQSLHHLLQAVTKPKAVRRYKGEGMPAFESTKRGDLFVTTLTDSQKAAISQVFKK